MGIITAAIIFLLVSIWAIAPSSGPGVWVVDECVAGPVALDLYSYRAATGAGKELCLLQYRY